MVQAEKTEQLVGVRPILLGMHAAVGVDNAVGVDDVVGVDAVASQTSHANRKKLL